ncbi:MAG: DUF357 domain-containing protein [Methanospirillaceae archaeon]|nr:DUF357 domain-containing protein [Methanospirillaceae archaeon]
MIPTDIPLSGIVDSYYEELLSSAGGIEFTPPRDTLLYSCSEEILEMATSYLSDARDNKKRGNTVDELACLWYAHGWIAGGCCIGLIHTRIRPDLLYIPDFCMGKEHSDYLITKTEKYQKMLKSALSAVKRAPPGGSPLAQGADCIILTVQSWLERGITYQKNTIHASALACFCYGYGILDAAVRSGLLCILHSPHLFTTEP